MQVQRADPAYRRRVLRTLAAVAALLLLALIGLVAWLRQAAEGLDRAGARALLTRMQLSCLVLIAFSLATLGAHLWLRGARIIAEQRFPPSDVHSVRDTRVREGADAVRVGRMSQGFGLALLLLALVVGVIGLLQLLH